MMEPATIRVELAPSWRLALGLGALHVFTLVPIWVVSPPTWAGVALSMLVAAHAAWTIRLLALLHDRRSIVALVVQSGRPCTLIARDAERMDGMVDASTVVTGLLVVLAATAAPCERGVRRRRRVVIVNGMLGDETFRQLRVLLKWGAQQAPEASPGAAGPPHHA